MKVMPLSDLLELADSGVWGAEDAEVGISVLRSTNFNADGTLDLGKLTFRLLEERDRTRKLLRSGDILLEKSGGGPKQPVGRVCLYRGDERPHAFGNFIARLRPRSEVLSEYVFYYLWQFHGSGKTGHYQKQTTGIRNLEFKRYLSIPVPICHLDEQRRIVDLLSRAEGIVRLRREARAKAQAIIPAMFLDMFGDPATNPKGWDVVPLSNVADVQGGLQVTSARASLPLERPYLRVANVYRALLDLTEVKTIRLTEAEFNRTCLRTGDLLFVEGHGNPQEVGRVAVWDGSIAGCTHQNHLIRARPRAHALLPTFACYLLNSQGGRQALLRAGKTTSGLSTISAQNVKDAAVMLPPLGNQARFEERCRSVLSVLAQQSDALEKSEAVFQSLLSRAFHGDQAAERSAQEAAVA